MAKTINKPEGEDREIDRHALLITQPHTHTKKDDFTASPLYAHLCLWNCNRLFQLHARLELGVVAIGVPLEVNLCEEIIPSCKHCKKKKKPSLFRLCFL